MAPQFLRKKVIDPTIALLARGITPKKVALGVACGIVLGIFPVVGLTTILCLLAATILRLNIPAIQLVNYLVYPLQLLLLIPFFYLGDLLFSTDPVPISAQQLIALFRLDYWGAIHTLWVKTLHAILAWLLVGPTLFLALYFIFIHLVKRLPVKIAAGET